MMEPEKWITVNGQHLPVYPGGIIGQPGQTPPTKESKTKTINKSTSKSSDLGTSDLVNYPVGTKLNIEGEEWTKSDADKWTNGNKSWESKKVYQRRLDGDDVEVQITTSSNTNKSSVDKKESSIGSTTKLPKSVQESRQVMQEMATSGKYKTTEQLQEAYVDYLSKLPTSSRNELAKSTSTGGKGVDRIMAMASDMANRSNLPARDRSFKEIREYNNRLRDLAQTNMNAQKPTTSRSANDIYNERKNIKGNTQEEATRREKLSEELSRTVVSGMKFGEVYKVPSGKGYEELRYVGSEMKNNRAYATFETPNKSRTGIVKEGSDLYGIQSMKSSQPATTSRNARYDTSRANNMSLVSKSSSALKTMYRNASPEEKKIIAAELTSRGFYRKNDRWTSMGGGR